MKGPRQAEYGQHGEERPHAVGADDRERQQDQGADCFQHVGKCHDQAPPETVGHCPGDKHENKRGKKLRQPDKTKVKRVAADVVDLPADRHRHDLRGEGIGKA